MKYMTNFLKCIILVVTQLSFNHVVNAPVGLTANCTIGDVHLLNGTSEHEGRVEVCFGNVWGTVCSKSWDNRDAGVICKQLFNSSFGRQCIRPYELCSLYYPLLRVHLGGYAINGSMFGSGNIPIVIQNINCIGTEKFLTDCSTATFTTSSTTSLCNNSTVAGIACYGKFIVI